MAAELTPEQLALLRVGVVLEQVAVYGRLIHRTAVMLERTLDDSDQRADASAIRYAVDQMTTVATLEHAELQRETGSPDSSGDIDPLKIN